MSKNIFRDNAKHYFDAGINVIPLYAESKRPLIEGWADYATNKIPEEVINAWCDLPNNHNIGMVLGAYSNIGVLDIDYADDKLIAEICKILPSGYDTWTRVGKKGMVFAFKYNPKVPKAFKLISKEHGTICEYLCSGQQVVLPPSIHPDTKQAYTANSNLWEVLDQLPTIPDDLEDQLRNLLALNGIDLSSKGVGTLVDYVPAGFRDSSLTQKAGLLAYEVVQGRISMQQAIDHLYVINDQFVENVEGDSMDMNKHVNNFIKFVQKTLIQRKTVLPKGWDEGLNVKLKEQLTTNEDFRVEETYESILAWYSLRADNSSGEDESLKLLDEAALRIAQIRTEDQINEAHVVSKLVAKSNLLVRPSDVKAKIKAKRIEIKKTMFLADLNKENNNDNGEVSDDMSTGAEVSLDTHTEVAVAALNQLGQINPIRVQDGILYRFMGSHWVAFPPEQVKQFIAKNFSHLDIVKRNSDVDGIFKQVLIMADQGIQTAFSCYVNVANGMILENADSTIKRDSAEYIAKVDELKNNVLKLPQVVMGMWTNEEIAKAQENAVAVFEKTQSKPLLFTNHNKEYGATYVLPYRYRPEELGKMPLFMQFLTDSWGKRKDFEQMVMALQEALYVTYMGAATKYQRAFLLYGVAGSGKSVLLKIIASLFPDETKSSVAFNKMSENRYMVSLNRKNINIIGELSETKRIEGDVFKAVIDGTPTTCYQLYKESFTMIPTAAHWAASNHLPKTLDASEGFTRRWLFFWFEDRVEESKVDVDLAKKIITQEREAIFAWALEAGARLRENRGFTLPTSHKQLLTVLSCQTNPALFYLMKDPSVQIKNFMKNVPESEHFEVSELDLFLQFKQFLRYGIGSNRNIEMQEFRHMLDELIKPRGIVRFTKEGDLQQWYSGIRIKQVIR